MSNDTRATLLERLRVGGDPLAWDEFFARYWRLIYAFARHRGCSEHTAEEIVQDVMLKVFEQRDVFQYDPRRGRFRDWLGALVRNKVAEHRRRPSERIRAVGGQSPAAPIESESGDAGPDAAWEAAFEQALLTILLDVVRREVNPRDYLAFELFALHELPGSEVARITGLTRNAVYKARKRVFRRLKDLSGTYPQDGQLGLRIKQALRRLPGAAVERSLTTQVQRTMRSR
jgi:RNA polymerase sigma factor (sigma-70 family)